MRISMRLICLLSILVCGLLNSGSTAFAKVIPDYKYDPKYQEAAWTEGERSLNAGEYEKAKVCFEESFTYNIDERPLKLAHIESLQGHHTEAIQAYKSAIESGISDALEAQYSKDKDFVAAANAVKLNNVGRDVLQVGLIGLCLLILYQAFTTKAFLPVVLMVLFVVHAWAESLSPDGAILTRFGISTISTFLAFQFWKKLGFTAAFFYGAIAILFNPIFHIQLESQTWQSIDLAGFVSVGLAFLLINLLERKLKVHQ